MSKRFVGWTMASVFAVLLMAGQAAGQGTAAANIPRTADGMPDLSGIWQVMNTAAWDLEPHQAQEGVPAGLGVVEGNVIPYLPEALEQREMNRANRDTLDPETKCFLPGVPRITYMEYPFQIVHTSRNVQFLYEYVHAVRHIFMEGEHLPGRIDWFMGDSRGRWEGDTLVVDSIHFDPQTWFDRSGNFHSEELHVVERYTMVTPDRLDYQVTIEDPQVFSRPWNIRMPIYRRAEENMQLLEYECYAFDDVFHVTPGMEVPTIDQFREP